MKTDPSSLIEVSLSLFRSKGYRRTSMADIGRASGLLKGSIYHHFPNKERLLIEVVRHVIGLFENGAFAEARRGDLSEKARLDGMIDAVESHYIQQRICVLVHLWPDALLESDEARGLIQQFFRDWRDLLAELLRSHHGEAEARRLSMDALVRIEGAVVWLQIAGEEDALRECCKQVRNLL